MNSDDLRNALAAGYYDVTADPVSVAKKIAEIKHQTPQEG